MIVTNKNRKTIAVFLMLLSSFCFAVMGAFIKLSGDLPTFEKAFFRNSVSLVIALFILAKNHQNPFGKRENRLALFARGFFGSIALVMYFYSVDHLILADSGMLNKMNPFFVTLLAFFFLKEKVSARKIIALFIALGGSILIIKPGFDYDTTFPALMGFMSAVLSGVAYVLVSYLGDKENSSVIVFWFSFISLFVTTPLAILHFEMPSAIQLTLLFSAGLLAAVGQYSLTFAYRFAPASEVSIYNFSNVIFSSLLGIAFFSEFPDLLSLAGYLLIIFAGYLIFKLRKVTKTQ